MGIWTIAKTFIDNESITAAKLNANFASLATFFNVTKLEGSNLQAATVALSNLVNPKSWVELHFQIDQVGTASTWTAAVDYNSYNSPIDSTYLPAEFIIKRISAFRRSIPGAAAGPKIKLYQSAFLGAQVEIVGTSLDLALADMATVDVSITVAANQQITLRVDDLNAFDQLPITVSVWGTLAHRS